MGIRNMGEKTRKPKESMKDEIFGQIFDAKKQNINDKINKKILLSGENGTGKTSLALYLLTYDLKDDEIIVYISVDNSGEEIIQSFYLDEYQSGNIRIYNPDAFTENEKGATVKDEETIVNNVTSAAEAVRQALEQDIHVKGVILDGVSFLLEYAEARMRLEKNLDADQGAQLSVWKIRNKFFRECTSAFMSLDTPVIYVTHSDFIPELVEQGKDLSSVKQRLIDECSMRLTIEKIPSVEDVNVEDYVATIRKDRSNIFSVGKKQVFMSANNKEETIDLQYDKVYDLIFPKANAKGNKK